MHIVTFATYFDHLRQTTSRNTITEILSELFAKADHTEIDKICYLALGRLAPKFVPLEFQLAKKLMVRAIAKASGQTAAHVASEFKRAGDLGDVIAKLQITNYKLKIKNQTVTQVYNKLLVIAHEEGEGSVERKITGLAALLTSLDPLSAKYIVRIALGIIRLGFSDTTILDALSFMKNKDKSFRKDLEYAYNVSADIGLIARTFKEQGERGIHRMKVHPGIPIRPQQAERLPSAREIIENLGECAIEYKLDGLRCVSGYTGVFLKEKGFTAVRDVKVGDYVLTHKGRYKKIRSKSKRTIQKKERLFRFQTYFGDEFKISEGHEILCFKNNKEKWVAIEEIKSGDELIFPIPRIKIKDKIPRKIEFSDDSGYKKSVKLNNNFFRFLGFWIGDGFTNNYHASERIGLHFNAKKETKLSNIYKKFITEVFAIKEISSYIHNGTLTLYWRDKPFRIWLTKYFRREWRGKTLPSWFAGIHKEMFEEFLKGWIESDGSQRVHGGFDIITKEKNLASFAQLIGLKFGIAIGLRRVRHHIKKISFSRTYYHLLIPGTGRKIRIVGDKILVKVLTNREIKKDPRQTLYNFEVEDDESYCTSMAILHNCQVHIQNLKFKIQNLKFGRKQKQLILGEEKGEKEVRIFSRNLEDTTHMFPEIVEAVRVLPVDSAIFDGEAIGIDPKNGTFLPFQDTAQRKRKHNITATAKKVPVKYFAFDILYLNGEDLLNKSFRERRKVLEQCLK